MNKKKTTKAINLVVKKETVVHLTTDMLRHVAGGAIPPTRHSQCWTACTG